MPTTSRKRIALILGHPDSDSLCGALARRYALAAQQAGHELRLFELGSVPFDPVLRHGYAQVQPLEPGLVAVRDAMAWANHLVFVYPVWWGAMPALLKGFFDRVFLSGWAYKYRKDSPWWDKLLLGRSALVITTMDTPPWYYRFVYRMPGHQQIRRTILGFCGVAPVRILSFGPVRNATDAQRAQWLDKVAALAR